MTPTECPKSHISDTIGGVILGRWAAAVVRRELITA